MRIRQDIERKFSVAVIRYQMGSAVCNSTRGFWFNEQGKKLSEQAPNNDSFVLNRYSLSPKSNSLENIYGSLGDNASEQGTNNDPLVLNRYPLSLKSNSLGNLYDPFGKNASEQGQNDKSLYHHLAGQGISFSGPGDSAGVRRRRNDECRLTNEDFRSSLTNKIRIETEDITEITNKLVARNSKLETQNINPYFLVLPGKRTVANKLINQSTAYET